MFSACVLQDHTSHWLPHPAEPVEDSTTSVTGQKRRASIQLEKVPAKKAKGLEQDDVEILADEDGEELQKLTELVGKQTAEIESLKKEIEETNDERDDWRLKHFALEDDVKELKNSKGSKGGDSALKQMSKKLEASNKQKWEQKVQAGKSDYDTKLAEWKTKALAKIAELKQKHKDDVQDRLEAHKQNKEELITKHHKEMEQMKQKMADNQQENRKAKDECAQLKKDLKREQQEEIRKHKPETNDLVREKTVLLKEKQAEIRKLQDGYEREKERADRLNTSFKALDATNTANELTIKINETEKQNLEDAIKAKGAAFAEVTKEFRAKLISEGQRWLIQYNSSQDRAGSISLHQRACLDLRNANTHRDKQIGEMTAEIGSLKSKFEDAEAKVASLSADVVTAQELAATTQKNIDEKSKQIEALTADKQRLKVQLETTEAEMKKLSDLIIAEQKSEDGVGMTDADAEFVHGMIGAIEGGGHRS
ncbi:hypothetical protein LTR08_007973 [Meristemomyces frigidus]|nr:hypothetical protein LTR08_007973 [Meristemomyces frigidus]